MYCESAPIAHSMQAYCETVPLADCGSRFATDNCYTEEVCVPATYECHDSYVTGAVGRVSAPAPVMPIAGRIIRRRDAAPVVHNAAVHHVAPALRSNVVEVTAPRHAHMQVVTLPRKHYVTEHNIVHDRPAPYPVRRVVEVPEPVPQYYEQPYIARRRTVVHHYPRVYHTREERHYWVDNEEGRN